MVMNNNQTYTSNRSPSKSINLNNNSIIIKENGYKRNGACSRVTDFYDNSTLFITGATGFVGKALLEKLLRSCDGIQCIYVLLRPKRGLSVQQRFDELIKNPVFNRIRAKQTGCLEKIKVVTGDVTHVNLGLNSSDLNILENTVEIVFHSAATVRFNETLKDAVILNTLGTGHVVELCKRMKNLKSFVHVSTAYSNADRREIGEIVYTPPYDPKLILQCLESLPNDVINIITKKIQGKHPNTYTLTKAMAEHIVLLADLPAAIVRPSIVTAAWKEPFPGWIDNLYGITGIMCEIGRGTIRSIICNDSLIMDLIPVDIVVNTIITAAWQTHVNRSNTIRVYNCISGQLNGVKWHEFGDMTKKYAIENPSKYVLFYPGFTFRTNRIIHKCCHVFLHSFPAIVIDLLLRFRGVKPIMLKIVNKFKRAAKGGEFFALNEWKFQTSNVKHLIDDLRQNTIDYKEFECDITNGFEWDPYVKSYMLGIRKYILKDDLNSLPNARKKLQRLYWAQKIIQILLIYLLLKHTILNKFL